jgi:hypothetical protein
VKVAARFRAARAVRSHAAVTVAKPPAVAVDSHAERARSPDEMNSADETPALADDH